MYVSGRSRDTAIALSATTAAITSAPSQAPRPRHARGRGCAQARASGMTTSAPDASAKNQLRQNVGISEDSTTPPTRRESIATVAVIAAPAAIATSIPPTCSSRSSAPRGPSSRRNSTAMTRMSAMFPAVIPSALASGWTGSAKARSPMSRPGHQRSPARYSAAAPRPAARSRPPAPRTAARGWPARPHSRRPRAPAPPRRTERPVEPSRHQSRGHVDRHRGQPARAWGAARR